MDYDLSLEIIVVDPEIILIIPYSASWGAIKTIRNMGQREDNSGDKRD
jgi:hypothetical protein